MGHPPVKRGLVERAEQWKWSSFRAYRYGEIGKVRGNYQEWTTAVKTLPVEKFNERSCTPRPLIRKKRE
jgi:hypothetical protein